jgi:hypothetical protein
MGTPHAATGGQHQAEWYEIRLKGHLNVRWAAWFDGLNLTHERDGTTIIHGPVADQAALHGLLQRVRDIGLPLLSVMQIDPERAIRPDGDADTNHDAPQRVVTARQPPQ